MSDALTRFQRILGYQFQDAQWLKLALTHRSVSGTRNNERLEFLGDGLLNFVIADCLYLQFPDQDEGRLSRLRATLVREESLAVIAREWQLGEFLLLGSGELKSGGYRRDSILADGVEAVIGAMHRDGVSLPDMQQHIRRWYGERLTRIEAGETLKDAKSRLQEALQGRRLTLPQYELLAVTGVDHDQHFRARCVVSGVPLAGGDSAFGAGRAIITEGEGGSRRIAEQEAAAAALAELLKTWEQARGQ